MDSGMGFACPFSNRLARGESCSVQPESAQNLAQNLAQLSNAEQVTMFRSGAVLSTASLQVGRRNFGVRSSLIPAAQIFLEAE
jgi:hypothetical protein